VGQSENDLTLQALEIARQEVQRLYSCRPVPKSLDRSDLLSAADETITLFFQRHPEATEEDFGLLRVIIRGDLGNALKKEQRRLRGIEIPDQRRDPAYDMLSYDALVARGVPDATASLVRRYYIDGETQAQIAASLGVVQSVVADRLAAAKKKIQEILRPTDIGTPSENIIGSMPEWDVLVDQGVITLKQGEVLMLSAEGYSQEQISGFLGIAKQNVDLRFQAGVRKLRTYLTSHGFRHSL
jgi:DNA-directed RNA polymerase specialized sigma24 family protein